MRLSTLARTVFVLSSLFLHIGAFAQINGTRTICPSGCDYSSLSSALTDLNTSGMNGPVMLELQASYTSGGETYPLSIGQYTGMSSTNTLTIQPANSVTSPLYISGSNASAIINLNNADYTTIDGRAGGSGSVSMLNISNASTSGSTLLINNDAISDTIRYCTIKGCNQSGTGGVVSFSTTTGSTGSDNNTLANCDIRDTVSTPYFGIYAAGSAGMANDNNRVLNCNIYNFWAPSATSLVAGVRLGADNDNWTISGNSMYATNSYSGTNAFNVYGIYTIANSGQTITNNYIGGSASNAGGGAWTITGLGQRSFFGMTVSGSTTVATTIQNNVVRNISFVTTSGVFCGIYCFNTLISAGGISNNIIGSNSAANSISINANSGTSSSCGIDLDALSGSTTVISNNTIGGITTGPSLTTTPHSVYGIRGTLSSGSCSLSITGNTIGSSSIPNSMVAHPYSLSSSQIVCGISVNAGGLHTVSNNTVANLNNKATGGGNSMTRGIVMASLGKKIVQGNIIHDLYQGSSNGAVGVNAAVIGIANTSASSTTDTLDQNMIYNLSAYNTSTSSSIYGIYMAGTTKSSVLNRNQIHTFVDISTSCVLAGIYISGGINYLTNNAIRLGIDTSGNSFNYGNAIYGIYSVTATSKDTLLHNSIYIGGTGTDNSSSTYCYYGTTTGSRYLYNNIFENVRSYTATNSGKGNYPLFLTGTLSGSTIPGLLENNNIYYYPGTGGAFLNNNGTFYNTLSAWQAATSYDAASLETNPGFKRPAGSSSTVDLHLRTTNPAEGAGSSTVTVPLDVDGNIRSLNTPTDIGADGGNFINGVALPVRLVSFEANVKNTNDVQLDWEVKQQLGLQQYVVERSEDGEHFLPIKNIPAQEGDFYTCHDIHPLKGKSYYRIRIVEMDGGNLFSQVRPVRIGDGTTAKAYVAGRTLVIEGSQAMKEKHATLADINAREILRIELTGERQEVDLKALTPGLYLLNMDGAGLKIVVK